MTSLPNCRPPPVGLSQQAAALELTPHLLQRGCRRIAYIAGELDTRVLRRREGFEQVLREFA